MPVAITDPATERALYPIGAVINKLKRLGILTNVLVAAATDVNDLIADTYAALRSGSTELFGNEPTQLVRRFEQGIRLMERKGLLTTAIVAALTTVNTASASTDLRYLVSSILTNTTLDMTTENNYAPELNYAYATTR